MTHHLLCDGRGLLQLVVEFAEQFAKDNPYGYLESSMSERKMLEVKTLCNKLLVSVNDYLLATLFSAANKDKIVIGTDVRMEITCIVCCGRRNCWRKTV